MNTAAEASQPVQNKHSPYTDDPNLNRPPQREMPILDRLTPPTPGTLMNRSKFRGNLRHGMLCHWDWIRIPKSVDNRSCYAAEEHREIDNVLIFCPSLCNETREARCNDAKQANLQERVEQQIDQSLSNRVHSGSSSSPQACSLPCSFASFCASSFLL